MTVRKPEFDILGLGTVAVDDTLYVEHYPPPDGKARVRHEARTFGGLVATALAAASRLGARCAFGAALGNDELSSAARGGLLEFGIDCRFVEHAPDAGPVHSVIIIDETAKTRNIFFNTARQRPIPAAKIEEPMIGCAKVLLLDQSGGETSLRAAARANRLGVPVVVDMEWTEEPTVEELMSATGHLLVPYDFAATFTGLSRPGEIVGELHRRRRRACTAVTCGRNGCYFLTAADHGDAFHMPAPVVQTVETTGCGDVFHGAYAAALAGGNTIIECLRFASAAAAAFAARPAGWQNLPVAEDMKPLLSSMEKL